MKNLTIYEQTWPQSDREWMVEMWNRTCPLGTLITVWPLEMKPFKTRTMSHAQLSSDCPIIMIEGCSGWIDLGRCLPLDEEAEESHD